MHKIYVAAPFAAISDARATADYLRSEGYMVVSQWHDTDDGLEYGAISKSVHEARRIANRDMSDIWKANALVQLTERGDESRGGMDVELGAFMRAADVLGGRIILFGPRRHIFHYLPDIEVYGSLKEIAVALRRERR